MKADPARQDGGWVIRAQASLMVAVAVGFFAACDGAAGAQRVVVEGEVRVAADPSTFGATYEVADHAVGSARLGFNDPDDRLPGVLGFPVQLPARMRLTLELTIARAAGDLPVFNLVNLRRLACFDSASHRSDPALFAGRDNGLYPSWNEPWPRDTAFSGFTSSDRDGDGVADYLDAFPDDPTEWADNDGDGVGDNADSDDDNDTMPDDYEDDHGLDKDTDDGGLDFDGDGLDNRTEYWVGSAPDDALSRFHLGFSLLPTDEVWLEWQGVAGRRYQVQFSDSLEIFENEGAPQDCTVDEPMGWQGFRSGERGFYRLSIGPSP